MKPWAVGNEAVSWSPVPVKSTWPALSGAPGAFIGFFGLRALRWERRGWDNLGIALSMQHPFGQGALERAVVMGTLGCW